MQDKTRVLAVTQNSGKASVDGRYRFHMRCHNGTTSCYFVPRTWRGGMRGLVRSVPRTRKKPASFGGPIYRPVLPDLCKTSISRLYKFGKTQAALLAGVFFVWNILDQIGRCDS